MPAQARIVLVWGLLILLMAVAGPDGLGTQPAASIKAMTNYQSKRRKVKAR